MKSLSVRTKLTLWNVGVLTLTLTLMGLAVFYGARESLFSSVDKDMRGRADRLIKRVVPVIDSPQRNVLVLGVTGGSPRLVFPGVSEPVSMLSHGKGEWEAVVPSQPAANDPTRPAFRPRILRPDGTTSQHDKPYDLAAFERAKKGEFEGFTEISIQNEVTRLWEPGRILTVPIKRGTEIVRVLQYPQPLSGTYHALSGLSTTLLTAVPLVLLFAAVGGVYLTGRVLKPVRELTETAAHVGAENLSERLDVKGDDEFSRLSQTFNGMLDRLQGAFGRMELAVEQQRRFTADACHELRTPLTVIKANSSLALKGERSAEDYKKTLVAVNAAADSMGRLVNDLLLLARSDSGKLEMHMAPTCLKPLLKEAVASVARPGVAEITLRLEDESLEIVGEGHSIIRVFVNLLENAAKYTPPEGFITISAAGEKDQVVVTVQDTGCGIDPEHLAHLCDRFYRVDEARARTQGGNGLGLSICSSIVEAHGGSLKIASVPNQGTTVTVRLPAPTASLPA